MICAAYKTRDAKLADHIRLISTALTRFETSELTAIDVAMYRLQDSIRVCLPKKIISRAYESRKHPKGRDVRQQFMRVTKDQKS